MSGSRSIQLGGVDPRGAASRISTVGSPCARRLPDGVARAVWTPHGAGSVLLRWSSGGAVSAEAWGPPDAVDWLLELAPRWLGLHDMPAWTPDHPLVAGLWRRHPGLRLGASALIWDEIAPTIVAQKVTGVEAHRTWRQLVGRFGEDCPGPAAAAFGLRLAPHPAVIAELGYSDLHRCGLERRRAETLIRTARRAKAIERLVDGPASLATQALQSIPGVGIWTATSTVALSHGHADTVVLRDFWLPTIVRYAFTGDRRWTDDDSAMLELLEPFAGHRARVCQLLMAAGVMPPRRAPRQRIRQIAAL